MLAALLVVALTYGPLSPLVARADVATTTPSAVSEQILDRTSIEERLEDRVADTTLLLPTIDDLIVQSSLESESSTTTTATSTTPTDPIPSTEPDPPAPLTDPVPPPEPDPSASSTSTTNSGDVAPEESDTDNTDFEDITNGGITAPCDPLAPGCVNDVSATTTEMAATDPQFAVATSTNGTGNKIGGTIFTGDATASTTITNTLNITKSNIDGPGKTNSSIIFFCNQ